MLRLSLVAFAVAATNGAPASTIASADGKFDVGEGLSKNSTKIETAHDNIKDPVQRGRALVNGGDAVSQDKWTDDDSTWKVPAPDVVPNPDCRPSEVTPAIESPSTVSELHPGHVRYVMALGDSATAAALADGLPLENRHKSWSIGSGSESSYTMPYLLQQYNAKSLIGPSVGKQEIPQFGPCCGKEPYYASFFGWDNQLNVALSGAFSSNWQIEIDHLKLLVTGHGFGIDGFGGFAKWSQREQDEYKSGWEGPHHHDGHE
jgi:hypothetical protein